ncbi:MAG TPA: LLM class flavin-dependent oxidoreductase [Candidatus Dormibacteraeota bacterium]|jgi:alkanesulfonate monooxygenase SsuD/methylene tetrahydromethanopterin reductase-like flavin-dependent oxidoreductase (luciferase family)|nr:LLM class flavin-dependent oxidoreductase [Candidatus Dormibacteraeota bacterium]
MRHGIIVTTGDPRTVADLAAEAEVAGWDGAFYFDAISVGDGEVYDPWVVMAAMAMRTERVILGPVVTPPSRRRPWKLARETMTLDRLSNGRLVLPVGLGALDDAAFGNVGEETETRTRADLMDESLEILEGLWSGRPYAHSGNHFQFDEMCFRPAPAQRPRIPIWVIGVWPRPRSMRRALRWDGVLIQAQDADGQGVETTPEHVREVAAHVRAERPGGLEGFEIVAGGMTPADEASTIVQRFADAGATWWLEQDWQGDVTAVRRRIAAGPPRV